MAIFEGVHEPIVDRATWERVQKKRGKARIRKSSDGEKNMFSGLVVCADCGHNLHFYFNQGNPDIKYFNCPNYKGNRGTCQSTRYVRVDFLEQVVLGEIRRLTRFASQYEDEFTQAVIGFSKESQVTERQQKQKELSSLLARDAEIDSVIEHLYVDNVSGKVSDERFLKMTKRYETEQSELAVLVKSLRMELDQKKGEAVTTEIFFPWCASIHEHGS